ncbi:MAG: hypothetical protein R2695_15860 [Acidimicrobiales bacterium]
MGVVIAIGAGTTGVRSLAIDEAGMPRGSAYREFTQHFRALAGSNTMPTRSGRP